MNAPRLRFKDDDGQEFPGWEENSLGDTLSIFSGYAFASCDSKSNGVKWLKIADVGIQQMTPNNPSYLPIELKNKHSNFLVFKDDYVIALTRPILNGKLKIAKVDQNYNESLLNQRVGKLVSNQEIDFVYFLLQLKNTVSQISDTISGTDPPNLSLNEIKGIRLTIPIDKKEQTKIANFLTVVDEKITQLTQKGELLASYKKGVMQQIFSQQLRFKDDDGQDFPEWEETTLAQVADPKIKWSFTGGPFGSNLKAEDYTDCGVRIIQLQNIGDGVFNDGYKIYTSENKANQLQSCNIYPNEIIISKMGDPVARCCMMPINEPRYLMASDGIRLAVDNSFFNTKFIHDSINYESFRKNALEVSTGSTRRRIGLDELRGLPINYPCLEEQTKIANFLSTLDDKINHNQTQLDAVKQYKQGLLQQLFV